MMRGWICASALLISLLACRADVPVVRPRILEQVPHDAKAYTQGLLIDGDVWLESTGNYGESDLREVERATGRVLRKVDLPKTLFGEGLALLEGKLYQLTWQENVCIVYDRKTFKEIGRFTYPGEGWGLTTDGKWLYMSDGSHEIRVLDPENFKEKRRIQVQGPAGPVRRLNELEWVEGEIWANVFQTGYIVRLDPETGRMLGGLDLGHLPLKKDRHRRQDVLNGIARDPETGEIWITGKWWKALYRIEWPSKEPNKTSPQGKDT